MTQPLENSHLGFRLGERDDGMRLDKALTATFCRSCILAGLSYLLDYLIYLLPARFWRDIGIAVEVSDQIASKGLESNLQSLASVLSIPGKP